MTLRLWALVVKDTNIVAIELWARASTNFCDAGGVPCVYQTKREALAVRKKSLYNGKPMYDVVQLVRK